MPNSQTPDEPLSPEFRRELIRLANRDRMCAEDILDLVALAEFEHGTGMNPTVNGVLADWKDSFDVEP